MMFNYDASCDLHSSADPGNSTRIFVSIDKQNIAERDQNMAGLNEFAQGLWQQITAEHDN